ncbi:hypothetical protein CMO94_02395 [Candidatus Woesearchaeota archaeon]|jgi:hypothetical protein|nr:hypothetical protein [Candidatus Woesearchaeota archaeon]|tara:strand:- start:779 stop:1141 length:363 start_codon:yes stop_codon:yes gene_type:complete
MSSKQDSRLTDRVGDILIHQEVKRSTVQSEIADAIAGTSAIVGGTLNKSTELYGLRVLSELGCTESQLRVLAQDFNTRGQEFAGTLPHPYNHDFPQIDYFDMQNGIGFDRYKADEQKNEQ